MTTSTEILREQQRKSSTLNFNWLSPKATPRPARGKGYGSFANQHIDAGETVTVFGGYAVTSAQLATFSEERVSRAIQVDDDHFILSGEEPEPGDFLNHSCDPNCGLSSGVVLKAMRDIAIGEELTFDYAMCDSAPYDEFRCLCGTASCRTTVGPDDWRRPELQERYHGWFSPYLASHIAKHTAPSV